MLSTADRSRLAGCFRKDPGGSIAVMFALMLTALCLFVGAAVDLGRWLQARQQTIAAADAAVLAGARILQLNDKDFTGARAAARKYYTENTRDRTTVIEDTIGFEPVDNGTAFAAVGRAYVPMTFLNFAHVSKLPLDVTSKALISTEELEVSMMLDVTGSMAGTKIVDLKAAAKDLVDIVISDNAGANKVRVAMVPFAEGVRLPSSANSKARGTPATRVDYTYRGNTYRYYPTDCVVERKGTNKYTDVAPGAGNYVMTLFDTGSCAIPSADEVVPLTKDKTTLKNKIQGLVLSGNTAGQIGTAWAWYMLSPNWNSLWSASSAASDYNTKARKIAILMTDGEYNQQYDTNGVGTNEYGAGAAANSDSTTQARSICTAIKAKNIVVYTVGFALGGNQTAITTLKQCATDATTFYNASSGSELRQAFRDIALKINQLYLTN